MANGVIIRKDNPEGTSRAGPISNTLSSNGSQNKDRQASSSMLNNRSTRNNPTPSNSTPSSNSSQFKGRSGRSNSSGKTTITSRSAPNNNSTLSNSNRGRTLSSNNVPGSNSTLNKPVARHNRSVSSKVHGSNIAHGTGSRTIAPGNNAGVIADTASLTTATGAILGRTMASESRGFPFWLSEDIHGFNTKAIG